jgi:phosphopentomutase
LSSQLIRASSLPVLSRVILIVLDSVGCGELPDAATYGDEGSDTLGNIAHAVGLRLPHLRALGLDRVANIGPPGAFRLKPEDEPTDVQLKAGVTAGTGRTDLGFACGKMAEASPGKDSVTGHWEMMGIVLERAFPTFPAGFPRPLIDGFEQRIGRKTLGNVVASGTEIIERLGAEHVQTGRPIVYTSADSVFQIAAHEAVIPVDELYRICEAAFDLVSRGLGVGRVIARPFVGEPGAFRRTANRHDYALEPTGETLLDRLTAAGIPVVSVGKIKDLFAGRGVSRAMSTASDMEGVDRVLEAMQDTPSGLIFANLVDFDAVYGHRNDVSGYAGNLERFDARLPGILGALAAGDLLVVTGDHGNDPTTPSTDHSREYVPLLLAGMRVVPGADVGVRATFADLGQTLAAAFGVGPLSHGASFLDDVMR